MGCEGRHQSVQAVFWRAGWRIVLAVLGLCFLLGSPGALGQSFVLTITNTPNPILLGSNINYSLSVSNATGENLNPGVITSAYGTNAEFISATNDFGFTNAPGLVVFDVPLNAFPANGVIEVFLELRGTNVGLLTNIFRVVIADDGRTIPGSNSVVSSIELPPEADLGISILGPANGVFPGDAFSYQLLATNAGPDAAPGVVVSNPFPANVSLTSLSPTGSVALSNGLVLFSVGTLTNQASAVATVSLLATNAAPTNLISATIHAPDVSDTNTSDNSFTTNVPILTPNTNQIAVTNLSVQELNHQTGWIEQRMVLSNRGPETVESLRLLVDNLTNDLVRLANATGTNWSTPYVAHGDGLDAGGEVEVVLEYYSPTRSTNGPDPTWTAYGTPALDLTPESGTGITVSRIVQINFTNPPSLNNGRMLLEWPATNNAVYQVIYSGQATFSNANGSLPLVSTPSGANRVQWLDYGPPRTLSAPSNSTSRFYQVIELP